MIESRSARSDTWRADAEAAAGSAPSGDEARGRELAADLARRLAHDALQVLAEESIIAAPLKGVLLLARWPELRGRRDLSDVDLLVHPEDFDRAERSLRKLGFMTTSRTNRGATLATHAWPLSIDLHHDLFTPYLFDMATSRVLERATLDARLFDVRVLRLDEEDLIAHIIGHAVKSRMVPTAPQVVEDLRWLLTTLEIDPQRHAAHLRRARMQRAAGYVLDTSAMALVPGTREILAALHLDAADRAAIRTARAHPTAYWTPHVLNGSARRGARSFTAQFPEAVTWRVQRLRARMART